MSMRLTRQDLHALVWDRPLTKLAAEFGLSDVALHKICRKFSVPTPPVGFWMKKAHGKAVTITPLPDPDSEDEIVVREGAASNEPEAVADARARVQAALSGEANAVGSNPIVKRTLEKLGKAKAARDGLVRSDGNTVVRVVIRPESLERASAILEQLVAQAERAGLSLTRSECAAAWLCNGETVEFELAEAADQVEHIATEKELAAVAEWQRERENYHRRYGYWKDWGEPKIPRWEQRYQGRLSIKLEDVRIKRDDRWWGEPMRRTFADSRTRQLTKAIPTIISTIAAMAAAKGHNREFDALRRAAEEKAARQRAEAERLRRLEEKAVTVLEQLLDEHARVERLRAFVAPLIVARPVLAERTGRLLSWAEARLKRFEADLSPEGLEQRFAATGLFDEDCD